MKQASIAAVFALAIPVCAMASPLVPSQGDVRSLGPLTVVTYFEPEADGLHVLLTISKTDGDPSSTLRVNTVLQDGQQTTVSVPREVGELPVRMVVARVGSGIEVTAPVTQ